MLQEFHTEFGCEHSKRALAIAGNRSRFYNFNQLRMFQFSLQFAAAVVYSPHSRHGRFIEEQLCFEAASDVFALGLSMAMWEQEM
jgi:hypothetical protein